MSAQGPQRSGLAARIDRIAAGATGAEALRDVSRLQYIYAQYLEFALWNDLADLFTVDGVATYGADTITGREKLRRFYIDTLGKGKVGLARGQYMPHFAMSPVITMDPDGRTVRGRWRVMTLIAQHGASAELEGGIYENEFRRENGHWKIARLHYYPAWGGKYEGAGWSETPEGAPYHYTPDRAGTPLPDTARTALVSAPPTAEPSAWLGELERRVARLNDEGDLVRLQNAYGFYVDKKLWDDAADLFATSATMEIDQQGVYVGRARIRKAMELAGPQGIKEGELNDRVQLQPVVDVSANGQRAWMRGSELRMTGVHHGASELGQGIFENEYVKQGGVWKIAAMHVYGRMRADYEKGPQYARAFDGPSTTLPPDRKPTGAARAYPDTFHPPFHYSNPMADRLDGDGSLLPTGAVTSARIAAAERALDVALARVGAENVADAYGYYIDDFAWDNTADLFAVNGWKELSYIGTYVGRERVRASMKMRYTNGRKRGGNFQAHQKTQPVITPSEDGQSAHIRLRLLQLGGTLARGGWIGGIYEDGAVKENGVWKISAMDLDYVFSADYKGGWANVAGAESRQYAPATSVPIPPDRPLRGVAYAPFPQRVETGFHYKNPVSGRMPPVMIPW